MSKLDDLIKVNDKKTVEPFNLIGRRSLIHTKEEAANILKENSYYFFMSAAITSGISVYLFFAGKNDIGFTTFLLVLGLFYLIMAICIRSYKSRIASILLLANFGYIFIRGLLNANGLSFVISFVFLTSAYRTVKASFYYHRVSKIKEES